jgi:hypothetical protein
MDLSEALRADFTAPAKRGVENVIGTFAATFYRCEKAEPHEGGMPWSRRRLHPYRATYPKVRAIIAPTRGAQQEPHRTHLGHRRTRRIPTLQRGGLGPPYTDPHGSRDLPPYSRSTNFLRLEECSNAYRSPASPVKLANCYKALRRIAATPLTGGSGQRPHFR